MFRPARLARLEQGYPREDKEEKVRFVPVPTDPLVVEGETIARRLIVGSCEVDILSDGLLRLPGSDQFDGVEEAAWRPRVDARPDGTIDLALRSFLVHTGSLLTLVDTGIGFFGSTEPAHIRRDGSVLDRILRLGIRPDDVGVVVNTHLHLDHAGGDFVRSASGVAHAFPNARYLVQGTEFEYAARMAPTGKSFYNIDSLDWLRSLGNLDLLEGDSVISPDGCIRTVVAPGHTPGHQMVVVESNGATFGCLGDIAPLKAHLEVPEWLSRVDADRSTAVDTKRRILAWACGTSAVIASTHDAFGPYRVEA